MKTQPRIIGLSGSSVWHNHAQPCDVDGDGAVTPLDALLVINYINSRPGAAALPLPPVSTPPYFDVPDGPSGQGDGLVTPLDVLVVINYINSHPAGSSEGESPTLASGRINQPADTDDLPGPTRGGHDVPTASLPLATVPAVAARRARPERIFAPDDSAWSLLEDVLPDLAEAVARGSCTR